jgi:hypothetical protein
LSNTLPLILPPCAQASELINIIATKMKRFVNFTIAINDWNLFLLRNK